MLVIRDPEPAAGGLFGDDPQALIREARRRARRRRALGGLALVAVGGLLAAAFVAGGGRRAGVIAETVSRPFANVSAFARQGELAFVSRGRLWVLDGARGTLRGLPVPAQETASSPAFSHDGRWLAYLVGRGPLLEASHIRLWLARANGTNAHQVGGITVARLVGWSPVADELAVTVQRPVHLFFGWSTMPTGLDLVSAAGKTRRLVTVPPAQARRAESIWAAAWSPDGRAIAVSTNSPARTASTSVRAVALAHPQHTTVWFSIRNSQLLPGICPAGCVPDSVIADLAGWWPRWGVAFWVYSSGMVHDLDSTPLAVVARPGARPRVIAQTLSNGTTDAVAAGAGGALAVVASTNDAGRFYAQGKFVETCVPATRACSALPRGPDVSLDPAWSPNGTQLAYVIAPADLAAAWPHPSWFAAHELYVWQRRTDSVLPLGPVDGAQVPTWSRNGRELLYVANDGLWLTHAGRDSAVEIAHPLYPERQWNAVGTSSAISFYGQIPWHTQFSWYSP